MLSAAMKRTAITVAGLVSGGALLWWQVQDTGLDRIGDGLARVGWGFALILVLSLLRFASRAAAWQALLGAGAGDAGGVGGAGAAPRFRRTLGAVVGGDAIGNVTPLSLVVGEPAKALYLAGIDGSARALAALAAENFFYSVSVALYVIAGTAAMLGEFALPSDVRLAGWVALGLMALVLAGGGWLAWQRPAAASALLARVPSRRAAAVVARVRRFEQDTYRFARHEGGRLARVAAAEAAFHALSFLEAWLTVWLVTGESQPAAAFVLDTFNRIANVVFRAIPLRIGVDQWTAEQVGLAIGLPAVVGTTVSLVRTGRMLVWALVGFALVARRTGGVRS
jgi:hypothetical protein